MNKFSPILVNFKMIGKSMLKINKSWNYYMPMLFKKRFLKILDSSKIIANIKSDTRDYDALDLFVSKD